MTLSASLVVFFLGAFVFFFTNRSFVGDSDPDSLFTLDLRIRSCEGLWPALTPDCLPGDFPRGLGMLAGVPIPLIILP